MRYLAIALIVVGVCAADFASVLLEFPEEQREGWSLASGLVLVGAAVYFAYDVWARYDKDVDK